MKTIKIKFVDFWDHFDHHHNFILDILQKKYVVELSDQPEYVFFSNFGDRMDHLQYDNCVKIFYTQENLTPDFNLCDYGIGFEYMDYEDRFFRYPLFYYRYQIDFRLMAQKHLFCEEEFAVRDKFCSMIVSNGLNADSIRNDFFEALSQYKKVDSGGRYKNNIGRPNGVPNKRKFQEKYKFALCFENTSRTGYTTEKIIEAFAAGTVPIYWGDPRIEEVFSKDSFINVMDFKSMSEAISKIVEIDQHDELYTKMLKTPALLHPEKDSLEIVNTNFEQFLFHIFEQPYEKAFRRNRQYWGERYQKRYAQMRKSYLREEKIKDFFKIQNQFGRMSKI
ncbi:MAG: glycosyltransferase family 10 [bacterium]|nr:glycosyltransferase family 10 [bacterium]